jgi:ABC-type transporter Mla MlaB component
MPTRITQIESARSETPAIEGFGEIGDQPAPTAFKVEGTLYLRDAELLEKICRDVGNQTKRPVTLELAGLSYLDSDSAAVLCRMKREQNVNLEGLHLFIEKVVELTEESEKAASYLPKQNRSVE